MGSRKTFPRKTFPLMAVGLATALALAACSSTTSDQGSGGEASGSVRTIRVEAQDTLRFQPESVTAKVGDRIRFVVTNAGHTKHDFFVGDEEAQRMHEEEMEMGSGMHHGDTALPALELAAGETKETTVTFDEPGTLFYGCHEPGHYAGGMVGTITVSG